MNQFINELKAIDTELVSLRKNAKRLKDRRFELEKQIIAILNEQKQPGVKFNNEAIVIKDKEKKLMNPKKQQEKDILDILYKNGVDDPESTYRQIENSKVRERFKDVSLKFTKLKK